MTDSERGLSLVEILVGTVVLGLVFTAAYAFLSGAQHTYSSGTTLQHLQERARVVLDLMANEVRRSGESVVTISTWNGSSQLTFSTNEGFSSGAIQWGAPITFRVEPETGETMNGADDDGDGLVDEGRIVRIQNGDSVTVTQSVGPGGLAVSLDAGQLQISLTLVGRDVGGRTLTAPLGTSVRLRN